MSAERPKDAPVTAALPGLVWVLQAKIDIGCEWYYAGTDTKAEAIALAAANGVMREWAAVLHVLNLDEIEIGEFRAYRKGED